MLLVSMSGVMCSQHQELMPSLYSSNLEKTVSRDLFQLNINSQNSLDGRNLRPNPDVSFFKRENGD